MMNSLDTKKFLTDELERRSKQNPRYSMRAFARALQMSPGALSLILSGRRRLSKDRALRIADLLGLSLKQKRAFVIGARSSLDFLDESDSFSQKFNDLSLDKFETISEWCHFGILSLVRTKGFQPKLSWVASRLGITVGEAKGAIDRLVRLGILDTSSNPWKQVGDPIMIENDVSTAATRHFQTQVLKMAQYSLENDSPQIRDISTITMAVNPKYMPMAIEEIRKFKIHLMDLLENKGPFQEVYQFAIQLFPVSKRLKI